MADATYQEGDQVTTGGLYRRIYPNRDYYKDNRATSNNFVPDRGEDDVSLYRAAERSPSEVLEGHENFGLLEIEAAVLWAMGKRVIYTPSKGGKGHVSAYGFTKKDAEPRRNAAVASRVLIPPTIPERPTT